MCENIRRGAVKLRFEADGTEIWCHLSVLREVRKYRLLQDGEWTELNSSINNHDNVTEVDCRSESACKTILEKGGFPIAWIQQQNSSYKNVHFWANVFAALEKVEDQRVAPAAVAQADVAQGDQRLVPITKLREVYQSFSLYNTKVLVSMAEVHKQNPGLITALWQTSYKTFEKYNNEDCWGFTVRRPLTTSPDTLDDVRSTNQFTAFLKANQNCLGTNPGGAPDFYRFVQREINPRATRKGFFANGLPATSSGRGGIDLLLSLEDGDTNRPIVTEVKVANDKNAFYALIQVLAYAVEFATPNQRRRLHNAYPVLQEDGNLDVAIILLNRASTNPDVTLPAVQCIVKQINERAGECQGLGTITLLNRPAGADEWAVTR